MKTCNSVQEDMSLALDGLLAPEEESRLMAHLELCPDCRETYATLRAVHNLLRDVGETPAPPQLLSRVMAEIAADSAPTDSTVRVITPPKRPWLRALGGIAACALLCVGLYRFSSQQPAGVYPAGTSSAESSQPDLRPLHPHSAALLPVPSQEDPGVARLVLTQLPDGAAALLPPLEQWQTLEDGSLCCTVEPQLLEQVCQALEEAGVEAAIPEPPWPFQCEIVLLPK